MRIAIEGPDGAGKTTVAHLLANTAEVGTRYVRSPAGEARRELLRSGAGIDPAARALLFAAVDLDAAAIGGPAVFDRCGVSGFVYRAAEGRRDDLHMLQALAVWHPGVLMPADCVLVVLDAWDETLDARMGARPGDVDPGALHAAAVRRIYRTAPSEIPRITPDPGTPPEQTAEVIRKVAADLDPETIRRAAMAWCLSL